MLYFIEFEPLCLNVLDIYVKFWLVLTLTADQIWSSHITHAANFKNFLF